jgi:hypothetical protein
MVWIRKKPIPDPWVKRNIRFRNTALYCQCKVPHTPSLTHPRCLCRREYYAGCESPITDEVQLSEYLSDYSAWESSSLNLSADRMDESGSVASQVCFSIIVAISEYLSLLLSLGVQQSQPVCGQDGRERQCCLSGRVFNYCGNI